MLQSITFHKMALSMRLFFLARPLVCCKSVGTLRVVNGFRPFPFTSRTLSGQENSQNDVLLFRSKEVQTILKKITGLNLEKVFKPQKKRLQPPKYVLVSDKKLKELTENATKDAEEQLQMPPVLEERQEITEVLSEDYTLAGLEKSKIVFTDISYGLSERERLIVVREPDGILRKATWEERDRISQIYFPRPHREIEPPPLFDDENLENVLKQERHEFLLDATCVQFEPDSADFIRVHRRVYEYIVKNEQYDMLRSTRHFGGMAFYLTRTKSIDGLLCDMMQRNLFDDAVDLVCLYHLLHPTSPSAAESKSKQLKGIELLKVYIESEASQKGKLELLLQQHEMTSETDEVKQ
ncbi:28S ribosomal protein S22, mitochondrial [Holothuria leucospilota]|uniref:28S ribosomal protein S22, mitochondrial n=1 Tax=Holothuria leucospilota TaxID=206669 RepID=A0A9Q0YJB0_HOLLE|nr:28S ribosomal protein S22, mitochondrial [Holothuria leucospilota]